MPSLPDAVILCGGAGTRLRSVTGDAPKVMASVAGRPFLELLLRQLHRHGFERAIMAVGYRRDAIRSRFGDEACGLRLSYSEETDPLGTGGALRNAVQLLESEIALVMNGDSYTDLDLDAFVASHQATAADASLAVVPADGRADCGSVFADAEGKLTGFAEKQDNARAPYINAGIYLLSKSLLLEIPSGLQISLERELLPRWLEAGRSIRAFVAGTRCVDIGTPERFSEAQQVLANAERHAASREPGEAPARSPRPGRRASPRASSEDSMIDDILRANIERSLEVHGRLLSACLPAMAKAAEALVSAYRTGHKAVFFGNGGSAADAQHLAAEFVGRYLRERVPLPALALNANSSAVTAISNDYGYAEVFARQLEALAVAGDVAVGISTSGNSPNVIQALRTARRMGLFTIGLTGASGGAQREVVDVLIAAPSEETPRIQECHILIGHSLCDAVEQAVTSEQAALREQKVAGD